VHYIKSKYHNKRLPVRKAIILFLSSWGSETRPWFIYKNMIQKFAWKTVKKYINELMAEGVVVQGPEGHCVLSSKFTRHRRRPQEFDNSQHFYIAPEVCIFTEVRVLGVNISIPGVYYPASLDDNLNILMPARYVTRVIYFVPHYDEYGYVHMIPQTHTVTFWNGRRDISGKGLADIAAKTISIGKTLSFRAAMKIYPRPGKPSGIGFVVNPGTLILGADSDKTLMEEYMAYNGEINFHSRPKDWNVIGHPDNDAWRIISQWRMNSNYAGGNTYGYAEVRTPGDKSRTTGQ